MEIHNLIKFVELIHTFREIERVLWLKGRDYPENDVEHSYQLAMVAWYAVSSQKLPLDTDKVVKYAMLHDLVEAYAGDVDAFDADPQRDEKKAKKEREALEKLKTEFPEFPDMLELIESYEARFDEESKFVYALDKVLPVINIYLDNGRTWQKRGIGFTLETLTVNKKIKIANHPEVSKYFDQLVEILKQEEPRLFPQAPEPQK